MSTCTRCIMNDHLPGIKYNDHGICNYCQTYDQFKKRIPNQTVLQKLFIKRMNAFKGKQEYDCLIGLSGGKDSSYVLHMLTNKYKLKVLTYTFDNGFLSEYAKQNITNLVEQIGVDHFFYKADWEFQKTFYQKMMKKLGIPCKACSFGAYGTSFRFAFEKNIPFVIHGRSPAQMFRELHPLSKDPTIPFIETNLTEYDREKQWETVTDVAERLMTLVDNTDEKNNNNDNFLKGLMTYFFPSIQDLLASDMIPEFLGYFIFHEYDEEQMKKTLEKELNWKRPDKDKTLSHADCLIHDAVEYLRVKKLGYLIIRPEISVLIRQGKITRKTALERVTADENNMVEPTESLKLLCKSLDLNYEKIKRNLSQCDQG